LKKILDVSGRTVFFSEREVVTEMQHMLFSVCFWFVSFSGVIWRSGAGFGCLIVLCVIDAAAVCKNWVAAASAAASSPFKTTELSILHKAPQAEAFAEF
jgi:hypothetical protein